MVFMSFPYNEPDHLKFSLCEKLSFLDLFDFEMILIIVSR